jgi:hypothetical protein
MLSQAEDTPMSVQRSGGFEIVAGYARARESRQARGLGQDFLAFAADSRRLAFAVCDGVGQSFYGDLAARVVGEALVRWLFSDQCRGADGDGVSQRLSAFLHQLRDRAAAQVAAQELPADAPALLRGVLETQRQRGSETMLAAGLIELGPLAENGGQLLLVWLGDCRLRVWHGAEEHTETLGIGVSTSERWSSVAGSVGTPHHDLASFTRDRPLTLVAYSDGLADLDICSARTIGPESDALMASAVTYGREDDACCLRINVPAVQAPA